MKKEILFKLMEKDADLQASEIDYNEICKDLQEFTQSKCV